MAVSKQAYRDIIPNKWAFAFVTHPKTGQDVHVKVLRRNRRGRYVQYKGQEFWVLSKHVKYEATQSMA